MATPRQGYRIASGEKVPSVTTILGRYKESGALTAWAYKQGRLHENLSWRALIKDKLTTFIGRAAESARDAVRAAITGLFGSSWDSEIPPAPAHLYDVVGKAAEAGTIAHDMIERHLLHGKHFLEGEPLPESAANADEETIRKARNSFAQFLKWNAQTKLRVVQTEKALVSEKHRYGGTWDGIGRDVDGKLVLIDWKTSNAVYGDYLYQLAAYAILIEECMPELGPVTGFHLLRVAKEHADFAHHYYGELEKERRGFLLMRELYDIDLIVKKRA
jgi:hypothetical protein